MIIKTAILKLEFDKVKEFLETLDLTLIDNPTKVFYIEDSDKIIGTISIDNSIIKCFGVDSDYQSLNIGSTLITEALNYFRENSIYSYSVYTKPKYKNLFLSLNFKLIVETERVALLEGGIELIEDKLESIKKQIEFSFGEINETVDIASIVMNANPMTLGHEYLIEKASRLHELVLVFVVEEDKSLFSFKERYSFVYLVSHKYSNVIVLPSSKYIVSLLTFPSYFLHDMNIVNIEYSKVDALIFRDYFMKKLYIKKRYLGSETKDYMIEYNNILKEILKDKVEIIDRITLNNKKIISAESVRELLKQKRFDEVKDYVPKEEYLLLMGLKEKWN